MSELCDILPHDGHNAELLYNIEKKNPWDIVKAERLPKDWGKTIKYRAGPRGRQHVKKGSIVSRREAYKVPKISLGPFPDRVLGRSGASVRLGTAKICQSQASERAFCCERAHCHVLINPNSSELLMATVILQ